MELSDLIVECGISRESMARFVAAPEPELIMCALAELVRQARDRDVQRERRALSGMWHDAAGALLRATGIDAAAEKRRPDGDMLLMMFMIALIEKRAAATTSKGAA